MKKIADANGVPIPGYARDNMGVVIVEQTQEYERYLKQKQMILSDKERISSLEDKINTLTMAVEKLLQERQ